MPPVKFERIVSCSSEDPAHPSKNLLFGREFNRKWKCKEGGEESATVIIQLSQPYILTGIDIGNESSSFVEVLVSRTSSPDDYQVLLGMSSFMTPMDARNEGSNRNRVRMFTTDNLSDSVRTEKWDRIKVVCTQPFNKHLQYGLSFIVLHTTEAKQDVRCKSPCKTLGRFALKGDDETDISIGSFFSRRKDLQASPPPSPVNLKGAAAVRDASSPANLAEQKNKKRKGSDDSTDSQKKKRGRPTRSPDTKNTNGSPLLAELKQLKHDSDKKDKCDDKGKANSDRVSTPSSKKKKATTLSHTDTAGPSSSAVQVLANDQSNVKKTVDASTNVTYKPFNKLFEGVGIVISGYENPGRSQFRDRALAMGATYSQNWNNSTSTHLICAFTSTPKYREVRGKAIIVTREWVDDCFQERKKLSWRRYALDKSEQKDANSSPEPEVWELIPDMCPQNSSPLPPASRRNSVAIQDTRVGSESEDSEDEIERIKAKKKLKAEKLEIEKKRETKENSKKTSEVSKDQQKPKYDPYNCSTDIDSEEEAESRLTKWSAEKDKKKDDFPCLPDFFRRKTFYLSSDLSESEKSTLKRYIIAYAGEIKTFKNNSISYVVTNNKSEVEAGSRHVFVTPKWVWECNDHQRLVSPILYKPN